MEGGVQNTIQQKKSIGSGVRLAKHPTLACELFRCLCSLGTMPNLCIRVLRINGVALSPSKGEMRVRLAVDGNTIGCTRAVPCTSTLEWNEALLITTKGFGVSHGVGGRSPTGLPIGQTPPFQALPLPILLKNNWDQRFQFFPFSELALIHRSR